MQSKAKLAPIVGGKDGVRGGSEREVPTVEVDATFGRLVGLGEGMKVSSLDDLPCCWLRDVMLECVGIRVSILSGLIEWGGRSRLA